MIKKIGLLIITLTGTCLSLMAQTDSLHQSMKRGEDLYAANCASCHMPAGEGVESVFPPLAHTDYLKNQQLLMSILLIGQQGEVKVNGKLYNSQMDPVSQMKDEEIADVLNFISNSWENKNDQIKPAQVKAERNKRKE